MKKRVAVIYGGRSGEHEVSIRSAKSIMSALDPSRYEILEYFITQEGRWQPRTIVPEPGANPDIDVVFPVVHGTFGEDGTLQGLLELADLPYVGAGVLASSAAMDKEVSKRLLRESGIPVVDYVVLRRGDRDFQRVEQAFGYPVFVKPANLGSSVGVSKARDREQLLRALDVASQYDRKVIVERAIIGHEVECAVLGNEEPQASVICEILPSREFYDYEDKYLLDKSRFDLPARLPGEMSDEVRRLAILGYQAHDCEGMARVDFLIEQSTGKIFLNELNTIPGFTSISMYPKMWEASALAYPQLLDVLIQLALQRHSAKQTLRFTR